MPRPTRYTRQLGRAVCRLVGAGMPLSAACRREGIGRRTVYDWRAAGRAGRAPYAAFARELDVAEARAEVLVLMQVLRAAPRDWRAAAWWLERRHPQRWAWRATVLHTTSPADMSDDEIEAALARHGYVRAPAASS